MNGYLLPLIQILSFGFTVGEAFHQRSPRWGRIYYLSMGILLVLGSLLVTVLISLGKGFSILTVPASWIFHFIAPVVPQDPLEKFFAGASTFLLSGLVLLLVLSFPLSVAFLLWRKKVADSKPKLRFFPTRRFRRKRSRGDDTHYFAGLDALTGEPVLISDESRLMHTHILGGTGTAKTEGGIIPSVVHDIVHGRGMIVFDLKGERDYFDRIEAACEYADRLDDLRYISLGTPQLSDTINPFRRGNSSEQKDKLISALNWTEEFYKKIAEIAVLKVCKALQTLNRPVTFRVLLAYLKDIGTLTALGEDLAKEGHANEISDLITILDKKTEKLAGLLSDLTAVVDSDFGPIFADPVGTLDFLEAYREKQIVFLQFNTGLYQETAVRLARLFLQDIKTMSNYVQTHLPASERHFFPIYVDEFAMVAFPAFIDLLNKARSAKIAITIAHQSLGDLEQFGPFIASQIQDNTNIKLIFRQTDPDSVNILSRMGGTYETEKLTYQTEEQIGTNVYTGVGTSRVVEKFRVDPNVIKELPRGYCALMEKDTNRICYLQTDYLPVRGSGAFLQKRLERPVVQTLTAPVTVRVQRGAVPEGMDHEMVPVL